MEQTIKSKFIPQQLLYFIAGRRCCQQFSCTFRRDEHAVLIDSARTLGLRSQFVLRRGQGCVKVFKQSCRHYLEEPKLLTLTPSTVMNMFTLLGQTTVGENDEDYGTNRWTIQPPSFNISFASYSQSTIINKPCHHQAMNVLNSLNINEFLSLINTYRVTVFDGTLSLDKSTLFPLIILKDFEAQNKTVRIICIEGEEIVAMYNGERLADSLGETIGETVGIELPLQNTISSVTQVVYTTAFYFLRTLFNKSAHNKFQLSHFVVSDVHLHAPYTDILLCELRQALLMEPNLKIVLLSQACDGTKFLDYFGEGAKFCINSSNLFNLNISYLEDIQNILCKEHIDKGPLIYKNQQQLYRNKNQRNFQLDKCLEAYEQIGTDTVIRTFLYAINYELVPVDYQHSINGKTALYISAQLGKVQHLRLLLFMGADPHIVNDTHENAISIAVAKGNVECVEILRNFCLHGYVPKNVKPQFINYDMIVDLIYLIYGKLRFSPGNILIILPTYYQLVKLNYMLLSNFLTGNLQEFSIFLLYNDMDKEYLNALIKSPMNKTKIVLATDIVESLPIAMSFQYLIDTACQMKPIYDEISNSTENRYVWAAKDCLLRRQSILDDGINKAFVEKHCFRLIPRKSFDTLKEFNEPPICTMQLDKICLTVKFLCPNSYIGEYLENTIAPPLKTKVNHTVAFLKKIEVLDDSEVATRLGCRLIDLPVSCQLGKTLIFGILLQCLDPILTIVSSLCTGDPLSLPFYEDIDSMWNRFTIYIQNCIKSERDRLAEDQLSDHIIFIRLFQEWQAQLKNETLSCYLTDEYGFMLNGFMEQLNSKRINIINSLRAANLIHSNGQLSIQRVSMNSKNWSLVKAALTAGMYPDICAVDHNHKTLHSGQSANVYLHTSSIFRKFFEPFQTTVQWLVCTKQENIIRYATAITPLTVAMFSGSENLSLNHSTEILSPSSKGSINFFIDEWIWMIVSKYDFDLVVKMRQEFFKVYNYFLKYCSALEKWRQDPKDRWQNLFFETLTKILENEDDFAGFQQCTNIGVRPTFKLQNNHLLRINSHFTWQQIINESNNVRVEKHFFLLYTDENPGSFYRKCDAFYIEKVIGKFVRPIASPTRHILVILYSKNPDVVSSICRVQIENDEFVLNEYFRNTIPMTDIIQSCSYLNVAAPDFTGCQVLSFLDKRIGNLIIDLFAFRHHWIHTYNN